MKRIAIAAACLPFLSTAIGAADRVWLEVKGPHFTLISDAGEKPARSAVWMFEQLRAGVVNLWPWAGVDGDRPFVIVMPKDESGMKELILPPSEQNRMPPSSGFYIGADRYFFVVRSDAQADHARDVNPHRAVFRAYVDMALRTGAGVRRDLPYWLRIGQSLLVMNTYVLDSDVEMGRPFTSYVQSLRAANGRMPLDELIAVESNAVFGNDFARINAFDRTAWGFVHYLIMGDGGAHRPEVGKYLGLIGEGRAPAVAFALAFGDMDKVTGAFAQYLTHPILPSMRVEGDKTISRDAFQVRALTLGESAPTRAALHVAMRRGDEAQSEIAAARKYQATAESFEAEGLLADANRQTAAARTAYSKAIDLGSKNFYAYFRKAGLTPQDDPMVWTVREEMLHRAIALAPRFASAYAMLGDVALRLGHGADGVAAVRRAVELQPTLFGYRLTLARVLGSSQQRDEALRAAREALELARTDAERDAANRMIATYARP